MPTVSETLGGWLQHAINNPKTTIQSILTSAMFVDVLLLGCGCLSVKWVSIAGGVLTVCKLGLGLLQSDAGTTLAVTPQSPVVPVPVKSHEIPDDATAIPVPPASK